MTHSERFNAICTHLRASAELWSDSPFCEPHLAWQSRYPELSNAMLALSDEQVESLEQHPKELHYFLGEHLPHVHALCSLTHIPAEYHHATLPARWSTDVPGRKWEQIIAFIGRLEAHNNHPSAATKTRFVDWCAGKSHLGQNISALLQRPLRAIEKDNDLCQLGREQAKKRGLAAEFVCSDVLQEEHRFAHEEHVLALHACGDLHRRLLDNWVRSASRSLTLSPCCYHLWLRSSLKPLSNFAQARDLYLDKNQVQLAVQETVTSSKRVRKQVDTLAQWRLSFDELQREQRGVDEYLNTPSLRLSVLNDGFASFIHQMCEHRQIALPKLIDYERLEQAGKDRFRRAKRLQLVRHGFRRALELWLVLDLVLFLEEHQAQVTLTEFCPRELTPRNLLIQANRS